MGRPNTVVAVSAAESEQLGAIARSRSLPHSLVRRARIVLMSAEGVSNQTIAARCGVSVPTISHWRRCWRERGVAGLHGQLRPGRPRSYGDEQVATLMRKVLHRRPPNATHWSVRTVAADTGISKSTVARYFAARNVLDGAVISQCKPRHRHQEFLAFLNHLDHNVPAELEAHLIADNYATHKHPRLKAWLARHPRFHLHYTPTYASWLNQVERWFALISHRAIRRGSFRSVRDLVQKIDGFVAHYNTHKRPFAWTATADSIFAKLQRLCKVIYGTQH